MIRVLFALILLLALALVAVSSGPEAARRPGVENLSADAFDSAITGREIDDVSTDTDDKPAEIPHNRTSPGVDDMSTLIRGAYSPAEVLRQSNDLDGHVIQIRGVISDVRAPHPLTFGSVRAPGFRTDNGYISLRTDEDYEAYDRGLGRFDLDDDKILSVRGRYVAVPNAGPDVTGILEVME